MLNGEWWEWLACYGAFAEKKVSMHSDKAQQRKQFGATAMPVPMQGMDRVAIAFTVENSVMRRVP
jgi:hypothetical protein